MIRNQRLKVHQVNSMRSRRLSGQIVIKEAIKFRKYIIFMDIYNSHHKSLPSYEVRLCDRICVTTQTNSLTLFATSLTFSVIY